MMNASEALTAVTHGQAHLHVLASVFRRDGWPMQADALEAQARWLGEALDVLRPDGDPHKATENGRYDRVGDGELDAMFSQAVAWRND